MPASMEINQDQLKETIREEIDTYINQKLTSLPVFQLSERILRVEEEIKHLGTRFDDMLHHMDKRFEQIDKRFEQVDKQFEMLEKRIGFVSWFVPVILTVVIMITPLLYKALS